MKLLKKIISISVLTAILPVFCYGQELSAVETAEIGVEALLQTVEESKGYFLTDRELYFSEIEKVAPNPLPKSYPK